MNRYLVKRAVFLAVAFFLVIFGFAYRETRLLLWVDHSRIGFPRSKNDPSLRSAGRQERIELAMPAALDLLEARIDAGLGLEQALTRVAAEMGVSAPDIADELSLLVGELRAGLPVGDAFRKLSSALTSMRSRRCVQSRFNRRVWAHPYRKRSQSRYRPQTTGPLIEEKAGKITAAMTCL